MSAWNKMSGKWKATFICFMLKGRPLILLFQKAKLRKVCKFWEYLSKHLQWKAGSPPWAPSWHFGTEGGLAEEGSAQWSGFGVIPAL